MRYVLADLSIAARRGDGQLTGAIREHDVQSIDLQFTIVGRFKRGSTLLLHSLTNTLIKRTEVSFREGVIQ